MNKKAKIAIAIGTTLVIGVGGILIYRAVNNNSKAAKSYIDELDENGGTPKRNLTKIPIITTRRAVDRGSSRNQLDV